MPEVWKAHCPMDEDSSDQRHAFHRGWEYRKEHGPGTPKMETVCVETADTPRCLSAWLQGYSAADDYLGNPP